MKILNLKSVNNKELELEIQLRLWIVSAYDIGHMKEKINDYLQKDDGQMVYGQKPSYFYDMDVDWFYLHLYHKNQHGDRKRLVFTLVLSGMESSVPPPRFFKTEMERYLEKNPQYKKLKK